MCFGHIIRQRAPQFGLGQPRRVKGTQKSAKGTPECFEHPMTLFASQIGSGHLGRLRANQKVLEGTPEIDKGTPKVSILGFFFVFFNFSQLNTLCFCDTHAMSGY